MFPLSMVFYNKTRPLDVPYRPMKIDIDSNSYTTDVQYATEI